MTAPAQPRRHSVSSEATVSTETVTRCQWPACPSSFTFQPVATGWRKITLSAPGHEQKLILCPFHAVEHVPALVAQAGKITATCSCRTLLPCERDAATVAVQDWKRHARDINGPEERDTCQECLRDFEPRPDGLLRRHNALDRVRGRLLSTLCPGAGLPPRAQVQR